MPILRHLHLPNFTTYAHASYLQELLVSRLLRYKAHLSNKTTENSISQSQPPAPPLPIVLTFTPYPIYTTGRREISPPSASQLAFLKQPLDTINGVQTADFAQALRGGQITFHGPGQLVVYPVISLARPYSLSSPHSSSSLAAPLTSASCTTSITRSSLSPRCYVSFLESTTINTLARYGIHGKRTENPGVWVDEDTKIAALGVHLRRNVTSHGVGLNVDTDLRWFGRIVACGLEGKAVTSMQEEILKMRSGDRGFVKGSEEEANTTDMDLSLENVARVWVHAFARGCGVEEGNVLRVTEEDILTEDDGVHT